MLEKIVIYYVCISLYMYSALAVKCHKCEIEDATYDDAQCNDVCEGAVCVKREAEMEDGKVKVSKICAASGKVGCGDAKLWGNHAGTQCFCDQDMCNTSPVITLSLYPIITIVLVTILPILF